MKDKNNTKMLALAINHDDQRDDVILDAFMAYKEHIGARTTSEALRRMILDLNKETKE